MKLNLITILSLLFTLGSTAILHSQDSLLITDTNEPTGTGTPISSTSHDGNASAAIGVGIGQSFVTTTGFNLSRIISFNKERNRVASEGEKS